MSSTEATNGISRRAVLAGAAAIGGTIAVASALGTGVTTVQAAPSVAGTAGATGANGAGGVAVNVYVQDGNVSASSDSGEPGWKQFGQQIGEYVTQLVDRRMSQSYRQGGLAWQASNNRLGA